jgi:hypothetical protein
VEIEVPNTESVIFPAPLEESIPLEQYERCKAADVQKDELDGKEEV